MTRPFITLDQVTVRVGGAWILDRLCWRIDSGQSWVLWGGNGSGKTTLAKTLMGQTAVVRGTVRRHYQTDAADCFHQVPIAMAAFDQHVELDRHERTMAHSRAFSHRLDETTRVRDALDPEGTDHHAFDLLEIGPLLDKPLQVLSAGEMRRFLICRAAIQNPRLLILDEPFNGIDDQTKPLLHDFMVRLMRSGTQLVLITHHRDDISSAFSHLLWIEQGRAKWQGALRDITPRRLPRRDQMTATSSTLKIPDLPNARPSRDGNVLVRMRGVTVRYGAQTVLTDIQWTVRQGEHWAVLGPNGAGKSTLLKLITGDNLQGYANDITLFGRPRASGVSLWQIKSNVGVVADALQLRSHNKMSGFDVVCSGLFDSIGLYRRTSKSQRERVRHWIATAGIEHLSRRPFPQLSEGQQRLVLIVRAVVKHPQLLILDEPCNGLDGPNRQKVLDLLDTIADHLPVSIICVSHRSEELPTCISHRLFLDHGRRVDPAD